uniref:Gfo/Idh/MocA family protein n=1 Tax=uncultured Draconibacterium sp. TaxID=1573823 RepID=UPI0032165A2F
MKENRRNFIKLSGLAGISLLGRNVFASNHTVATPHLPATKKYKQQFNMCGYAAPKIENVRIGFIGLGNRGPGAVERMSHIEGVEIKALCDIRSERVELVREKLKDSPHQPVTYTGTEDTWKKLCERDDLDLIYITTPWHLHTPMAVYAMNHGKHACSEVPAATTLDECWQLVEASERNKKHCMMLENCCYDFFELLTLNMARQGFFGEIIHGEGAYLHDILEGNFSKTKYWNMWRLKQNYRNGNLYPTHGLGPICQIMNTNRGDKMEYLVSVSSDDFSMNKMAKQLASDDNFYEEFAGHSYRGNMNTTTIKTIKGRTIMLQHDVSSTRPYSRIHKVCGTKAMALKYPDPPRISNGHEWISAEEFKRLEKQYEPKIVAKVGEMAKQVGGHGGMDFLMDWRTIDCLRNGLPLEQDVYDAALWSSIAPLSEISVANRGQSVDVPDFTCGSWKNNKPVDVSMNRGGTTGVI